MWKKARDDNTSVNTANPWAKFHFTFRFCGRGPNLIPNLTIIISLNLHHRPVNRTVKWHNPTALHYNMTLEMVNTKPMLTSHVPPASSTPHSRPRCHQHGREIRGFVIVSCCTTSLLLNSISYNANYRIDNPLITLVVHLVTHVNIATEFPARAPIRAKNIYAKHRHKNKLDVQ